MVEEIEKDKDFLSNDFKMVAFSLDGKDFGIDILQVKEIARFSYFTYVPNSIEYVKGVYNLRGDIISVIDLRTLFAIKQDKNDLEENEPYNKQIEEKPEEKKEDKKFESGLILRTEDGNMLGMIVDKIDKVVTVPYSEIKPPHPLFVSLDRKYIKGVVENADKLYIILDIGNVIAKPVEVEDTNEQLPSLDNLKEFEDMGFLRTYKTESLEEPVYEEEQKVSLESDTLLQTKDSGELSSSMDKIIDTTLKRMDEMGLYVSENQEQNKTYSEKNKKIVQDYKKRLEEYGFIVSPFNMLWFESQFQNIIEENKIIQTQDDYENFLNTFYSECTSSIWNDEYADEFLKSVSFSSESTINILDLGVGKGYETYSVYCILKNKFPALRINIWGIDSDFLAIAESNILVIEKEKRQKYIENFVINSKSIFTFKKEVRNAITFEYHDITKPRKFPKLDLIIARDIFSFIEYENQMPVLQMLKNQLKTNGYFIVGDRESLEFDKEFTNLNNAKISVFRKK